jgi:flagellar biosynthesis protein FlhB
MFKDVPTADVVVVNPVHIAVALRYDPACAPAPYVVAVGRRKIAERIKQLAYDAEVPVVENVPLARALVATVKVGTMIPAELYVAVAEVLAFVIRQRARRGATPSRIARRSGTARGPRRPEGAGPRDRERHSRPVARGAYPARSAVR